MQGFAVINLIILLMPLFWFFSCEGGAKKKVGRCNLGNEVWEIGHR